MDAVRRRERAEGKDMSCNNTLIGLLTLSCQALSRVLTSIFCSSFLALSLIASASSFPCRSPSPSVSASFKASSFQCASSERREKPAVLSAGREADKEGTEDRGASMVKRDRRRQKNCTHSRAKSLI